ncbi:hypothetical protein SH668x_002732 [Planctomicrobium sp. SH668]|uniref:hypothetical protein n=1 Tax=Planctomicrobium sp. SH668 TaxID=3448126 RepID=UPI003F5C8B26
MSNDFIGIDINSSDFSDEPLDVEGLGLDDLGFGETPKNEPDSAQQAAATDSPTPSDLEDEDPLAWIVKASKSPVAPLKSQPVLDDDWDDFGSGLDDETSEVESEDVEPVVSHSQKSRAYSLNDVEELDDFDAGLDLDAESDEPVAKPKATLEAKSTRDRYWDALEGWDGWEDKQPEAARAADEIEGESPAKRKGRGRPRRGDRKTDSRRGRAPVEAAAKDASEDFEYEAVSEPEIATEEVTSESPRRERSRRGNSRRGAKRPNNAVQAEKAPESLETADHAQSTAEESEAPRERGRNPRGRGPRNGRISTQSEVSAEEASARPAPFKTDESQPSQERPARPSRNRKGRPQPTAAVSVDENDDGDFGGGILSTPAPAPERKKPARVKKPVASQDDFGADLDDDYEDDAPSVASETFSADESDDFGAGLIDAAPQKPARRRPPRRRHANAERDVPEQEQEVAEAAPRSRTQREPAAPVVPDRQHEDIPTWEYAISLLVKKQGRSSGSKRPSNSGGSGQNRKRGSGQNRGGERRSAPEAQ